MQRGGIGWYPQSHFIHLDSGPVRNWDLGGEGFEAAAGGDARELIAEGALGVSTRPAASSAWRAAEARLSANQRLALHRLVAKAEALAVGH